MPSIAHSKAPLTPTAQGLRAVKDETFRVLCKKLVASAYLPGLSEEVVEARLRYITAETLLGRRARSFDEMTEFIAANQDIVDNAWRAAIESMMKTIDTDFAGTVQRELGVTLPRPQDG